MEEKGDGEEEVWVAARMQQGCWLSLIPATLSCCDLGSDLGQVTYPLRFLFQVKQHGIVKKRKLWSPIFVVRDPGFACTTCVTLRKSFISFHP